MDFSKSDCGSFIPSESQWCAFQTFRLLYGKSSLSLCMYLLQYLFFSAITEEWFWPSLCSTC